jgi:hypothetical protein
MNGVLSEFVEVAAFSDLDPSRASNVDQQGRGGGLLA